MHTWALPRTIGSQIYQSEDWFQVVSRDFKSSAFNEVLLSRVLDSEIEGRILETIKLYADIGTDFNWCLHPYSTPANTTELLKKHGFINWQSRMMYARVFELKLATFSKEIEIRKVNSEEMDSFAHLFMRCWNIKPEEHGLMKRQLLFDNQQTSVCFERFFAFVNGKPAGVASMVRNPYCGHLHAAAVLPEFHGKGVYRALVNGRVDILRSAGAMLAITGARENTSAPRLEKMGFLTAWPVQMFLKKYRP